MEETTDEISVEKVFNETFKKKILNKNFANARKEVENLLGINLTLIELVELRKDVEFTSEVYVNDRIKFVKSVVGGDKYSIRPDFEAVLLFMNRNYGTQMYDDLYTDYHKFSYWKKELEIKAGYDYYPEYFKRVQEEMHFP
jgi:hypothetical protein